MFLTKLLVPVVFIAIGISIGIQFGSIQVPDDFERPWLYRLMFVSFNVIGKISKCLKYFNYQNEYDSHRMMTNYLFNFNDNFKSNDISNTTFRLVNVKIFKPKNYKEEYDMPAMVYIPGNFRAFSNIKHYDLYLLRLSRRLNMKIIKVDYKLPPEFSFETQLEECFTVMSYILKHSRRLYIDLNRVVIAGDSEGGHLVIALNQKLHEEERFVPKLAVLIYPTVQMFNYRLPSSLKFKTGLLSSADISSGKLALWNLGIKGASDEMIEALNSNSHITLLKNQSLVKQTLNYMALVRISSKYKDSSYNNYQISVPEKAPKIFKEKKKFTKQLLKVFNNRFSPAIVPTNELMVAPASYFIVCGTDGLKDEQLIYAERLKSVQRPVEIAYYKNAFHGIAPLVDSKWGFDVARTMLNDLVKYIEKNV